MNTIDEPQSRRLRWVRLALMLNIRLENIQGNAARRRNKVTAAPESSPMFTPEETPELIQNRRSGLGLELCHDRRQTTTRRHRNQKVDMVVLPVDIRNSATDLKSQTLYDIAGERSPLWDQDMPAKLRAKDDVVVEPIDAVARCFKQLVPNHLAHVLDELYPKALTDDPYAGKELLCVATR